MKKQLLFIFSFISIFIHAENNRVIWDIDNLSSIGGFAVTAFGNPKVISTENGNALEFNGSATTAPATNAGDRIQIKGNPLADANTEFTIEMLFQPYATETDFAPRVFHICRPDSMSGPRVMTMEIRSTNTWTTDFYIKSVTGSGRMGTVSYPTGKWMHMAMTCKNNVMNGYVNGVLDVTYTGTAYTGLPATAEVSLGGRMNNVNYFKGAIRRMIFTPLALEPSQFTMDGVTALENITSGDYSLAQNYPNPVCESTVISYTLGRTEKVTINIYNNTGQIVKSLVDAVKNAGKHEENFEKCNLPAGLYFYTLTTASGYTDTKKMIVQ